MSKEELQVNFRMPAVLKLRLEQAAKESRRSVTAEVVARLEESFTPQAAEAKSMGDLIEQLIVMGKAQGLPVTVTLGEIPDEEADDES